LSSFGTKKTGEGGERSWVVGKEKGEKKGGKGRRKKNDEKRENGRGELVALRHRHWDGGSTSEILNKSSIKKQEKTRRKKGPQLGGLTGSQERTGERRLGFHREKERRLIRKCGWNKTIVGGERKSKKYESKGRKGDGKNHTSR